MRSRDRSPGRAPSSARRQQFGLSFLFGSIALGTMLWLAFREHNLSNQQFEILRIVLALAGGGVVAVFPGFLDVTLKSGTKLTLHAGGALAVFVALYFWSPAHWQPSPGLVYQHTEGNASPTQNGDGNNVTINGRLQR